LLELRDVLEGDGFLEIFAQKDILKEDLIAFELKVLFEEFRIKRNVLFQYEELATALRSLAELEAGAPVAVGLDIGFDVMHPDGKHYIVVYLSGDDFAGLCRKVGVPTAALSGPGLDLVLYFTGRDLSDLSRQVLVEQAIPKMVQLFVSAQMSGQVLDAGSFLDYNSWTVGLR
jgi:hypothetical protein